MSEGAAAQSHLESIPVIRPKGPTHISKLESETKREVIKLVINEVDVAEIHSPPRTADNAPEMQPKGGCSLDPTTRDSDGRPCGFSKRDMRERAATRIKRDQPLFTIGSPMCTDWGTTLDLNRDRMDPGSHEGATVKSSTVAWKILHPSA